MSYKIPHHRWGERPLACVVLKKEYENRVSKEDILNFLTGKFPKWWLPEDVIFVKEIPKTSVGKFNKKLLRDQFKGYKR